MISRHDRSSAIVGPVRQSARKLKREEKCKGEKTVISRHVQSSAAFDPSDLFDSSDKVRANPENLLAKEWTTAILLKKG